MKDEARDLDEILADTKKVEDALCAAVKHALRRHKQAGNPIAVWQNGQVVWLAPEEIPNDIGIGP
jgi:hypothetical protein